MCTHMHMPVCVCVCGGRGAVRQTPAFWSNASSCRLNQDELILSPRGLIIEQGGRVLAPALPHLVDLWRPHPDHLFVLGVGEENVQVLSLLGISVVCRPHAKFHVLLLAGQVLYVVGP